MAQKQNGPEIHPAVEAGNPERQRHAEAFSESTKKALASAGALAEVYKRRKKKKATITMLLRVMTAIALSVLAVVLKQCGHVSAEVAFVSLLILEAWAMLWLGAWVQFMWGKWGGWC